LAAAADSPPGLPPASTIIFAFEVSVSVVMELILGLIGTLTGIFALVMTVVIWQKQKQDQERLYQQQQ
jgi:hypothetical protein